MKPADYLTKHRNAFLLLLLLATLYASSMVNRDRIEGSVQTVSIPVTESSAVPLSKLEAYRQQRDNATLADIAALQALCEQTTLEKQTREDAAQQLQDIISQRQAQLDLEGALLESDLSPCVAVVSSQSVTIVTEKASLTDRDSALVMTLAAAHTSVSPANVQIITAE
ncbi:MAG: SpoIIIAH-like family protein [Clostridia bacterium]|nr:SpoIIIAH-like family protein [Clostridia bacterium]